jgi:hypothetical protein
MRKSSEPADDIGMISGVFQVLRIASAREQLDAALLIGQVFGMHQRHIEKGAQRGIDAGIESAFDCADGDVAGLHVGGVDAAIAAEDVARKLVQHDDERQRTVVAGLPRSELAVFSGLPEIEETPANLRVEGLIGGEPLVRPGFGPEREDVRGRDAADLTRLCFVRLAAQAAAFFSSRSSRRRILPTLVFGRSVLNSICFGTL